MRLIIVALILLTNVNPSIATIDPDPDQIGIYFDSEANVACIDQPPSTPFWAYLIITSPSSTEVQGVEFSLCAEVEGGNTGLLFRLATVWENDPIGDPVVTDWCTEGVVKNWAVPIVPQGGIALLARFQYMILADVGVNFYLGPNSDQSIPDGLPSYRGFEGIVLSLGVSSGDPSLPVASVNGCNAVNLNLSTFGSLKCLYR